MGLKQRNVFEVVLIEKGVKLMGRTTRNEYKVVNCEFSKCKSRLYMMGNQQLEGLQYSTRPVCTSPEALQVETSGCNGISQQDLHDQVRHNSSILVWGCGGRLVHARTRLVA